MAANLDMIEKTVHMIKTPEHAHRQLDFNSANIQNDNSLKRFVYSKIHKYLSSSSTTTFATTTLRMTSIHYTRQHIEPWFASQFHYFYQCLQMMKYVVFVLVLIILNIIIILIF
eukprot:UN07292